MRRLLIVCIAVTALAEAAIAQDAPVPQGDAPAQDQFAGQAVKLTGILQVVDGQIGLVANGTNYILSRLERLVGFVKEIQEGATVTVEGEAFAIPTQSDYSVLEIVKLSIGGKDYNFGNLGNRDFGPMGGGRDMGRGGMGQGTRW